VSDNGGPEKLVSQGSKGRAKIPWIRSGRHYDFRLYSTEEPRREIASIRVSRSEIATESLLAEVTGRLGAEEVEPAELATFISGLIKPRLDQPGFAKLFAALEESGLHVMRVGDDEPGWDTRKLAGKAWTEPQELAGLDLNPTSQRHFVQDIFPNYRKELAQTPTSHSKAGDRSFLDNGRYGGLDAAIAYCMVRALVPQRVIEIGGGHSTLILRKAMRTNRRGWLVCVEPQPEKFLLDPKGAPDELVQQDFATFDTARILELEHGDILSVRLSHVIKPCGTVNRFFLEILPRLKTGVIIQLQDIFLPFDYPEEWILRRRRFWTAQYLLQAFLSGNVDFEVLVNTGYLLAAHRADLRSAFPCCERLEGGSFWMRRRRSLGAKRVVLRPPANPL
jgi:hypothetical protein